MSKPDWKHHLARFTAVMVLVLLLGLWSGQWLLFLGGFLLLYLAWQFYNSLSLYRWLQAADKEPPESLGMWAEIFDRIATLQKQNRKRNRQYREMIDDFRSMTDAFPDATLVVDHHDVITWFNGSAMQLLGLSVTADRGQAVTNLIRDPAFADWLSVQDKLSSPLEIACPTDDNITLQVSAVRFRKKQRLLILRDISDIRNLHRLRNDLVANVSHELRTPLTVLLGYLEILKDQPGKPDPETIQRMHKQASQMHNLLEDLLELSHLQDATQRDKSTAVDIPEMLADLFEQAQALSQNRLHLNFDIEPGLNMLGVETELKSAFQNLIVNAINYTPENGHITVSWQATNDNLVFSVKDSGRGIPHRDIPRITERFYRVGEDRNRKTGGTGLGLAIVKHVLSSHDAKLDILSELGEGSEFRCIFPARRKA